MTMKKHITEYQTLVFDCDGVLLNSNKVKTQAFYNVAKVYGHEPAHALRTYHVQNGGISRYAKFEYLFTNILKTPIDPTTLQILLDNFAYEVKKTLLTCEVAEGLKELREKTLHAKWLVVSGGDQNELREVFAIRDLLKYFNGGVFGSPDTKDIILEREIKSLNIVQPALFLGDSKYDYRAAMNAKLDFIFLAKWSEVEDCSTWLRENNISNFSALSKI